MMLSTITTKSSIKKVLKWVFSGFSIFFISILIFILVHEVMTGAFSQTSAEIFNKVWIFSVTRLLVNIIERQVT